jgi:hypothetical protein
MKLLTILVGGILVIFLLALLLGLCIAADDEDEDWKNDIKF